MPPFEVEHVECNPPGNPAERFVIIGVVPLADPNQGMFMELGLSMLHADVHTSIQALGRFLAASLEAQEQGHITEERAPQLLAMTVDAWEKQKKEIAVMSRRLAMQNVPHE